jgi:serine/threonine protein kinase SCH9
MSRHTGFSLGQSTSSKRISFAGVRSSPGRTNLPSSSARHEHRHDDLHELVGSNSPTPSGVETPRPDLHDKRLPGIMHSYFGQVGRDPSQIVPSRSSQAIPLPELQASAPKASSSQKEEEDKGKSRRVSTASMGSMVMVEREHLSVPTPPPDEPNQELSKPVTELDASHLPPTPVSSAASVVNRDGEAAENGGGSMLDNGLASITQALRNFVLPKSSSSVKDRRHQSLPVSSVTRSTVSAAHISNPTSSPQSSRAESPRSPSPSHVKPSPEVLRESDELTSNVAPALREKNTPPHTPRALSQEDYRRADTRSPLSSTSTAASDIHIFNEKQHRAKDQLPTTSTPRGKLNIKIAEARNLKASYDPYVVCQFEWNEYVSKGAKNDRMDVDNDDQKGTVGQLSSIALRRTDSDMGKPMAIPMRSRQSSTNGNGEERGLNKVTDPQWDHEAML